MCEMLAEPTIEQRRGEARFVVTIEDEGRLVLCAACLEEALYGASVESVEYCHNYLAGCVGCGVTENA